MYALIANTISQVLKNKIREFFATIGHPFPNNSTAKKILFETCRQLKDEMPLTDSNEYRIKLSNYP